MPIENKKRTLDWRIKIKVKASNLLTSFAETHWKKTMKVTITNRKRVDDMFMEDLMIDLGTALDL